MSEKGVASFSERRLTESYYMMDVVGYLKSRKDTAKVVEADVETQKRDDIDLFWHKKTGEIASIEVKIDAQAHDTGNFAFETISNEMNTTRGCILRTNSQYLYYYWGVSGDLWRMETKRVQQWFVDEMTSRPKRFKVVDTATQLENGKVYTSICRLVPLRDLQKGLGTNLHYKKLKGN